MSGKLHVHKLDLGYLRKSDKDRITEKLRAAREKELQLLKNRGASNTEVVSLLSEMAAELHDLYNREKGFEGSDRLYSVGREISYLLQTVGLGQRFDRLLVSRFRKVFEEKLTGDSSQVFYLSKARSLMDGLGDHAKVTFEAMLSELRVAEDREFQPDLTDAAAPKAHP